MVQLLLDKGSNLNKVDRRGFTPLQYAADYGRKDVAQLLLDKGLQCLLARVAE